MVQVAIGITIGSLPPYWRFAFEADVLFVSEIGLFFSSFIIYSIGSKKKGGGLGFAF